MSRLKNGWLLLKLLGAPGMLSRNSSPAAKKASFKTPDDKPKPKSGLQRSGTKVASKAAQKSMDAIWEQVEALEAEGRYRRRRNCRRAASRRRSRCSTTNASR